MIRNRIENPPNHHVRVILSIKQEITSNIDPTAYTMIDSVFIAVLIRITTYTTNRKGKRSYFPFRFVTVFQTFLS